MAISLEKKLEEATVAKKRYRLLFLFSFVAFLVVVSIVYNKTILDYAVLDKVSIDRENGTNKVIFKYDVVKSGRIDFVYGNAILTDRKEIQTNEGFQWSWNAKGPTEIKIRSRKGVLPHWDTQKFNY